VGSHLQDLTQGQQVALAYMLMLRNCADVCFSEAAKQASLKDPEFRATLDNLELALTYASSILTSEISSNESCNSADVSITVKTISKAFNLSEACSERIFEFI